MTNDGPLTGAWRPSRPYKVLIVGMGRGKTHSATATSPATATMIVPQTSTDKEEYGSE